MSVCDVLQGMRGEGAAIGSGRRDAAPSPLHPLHPLPLSPCGSMVEFYIEILIFSFNG
jgi:hypothetical protein